MYVHGRNIESAIYQTSFHGETWYKCPHCGNGVELYSFKSTNEKYVYQCPYCEKEVYKP